MSREDAASPTVFMESISFTTVIDAKKNRDIMTTDIPNAFIQAHMPEIKNGEHPVIMKITGVLVDLLVKLAPDFIHPMWYLKMEERYSTLRCYKHCMECLWLHYSGIRH